MHQNCDEGRTFPKLPQKALSQGASAESYYSGCKPIITIKLAQGVRACCQQFECEFRLGLVWGVDLVTPLHDTQP